jgi:hypothetical protein
MAATAPVDLVSAAAHGAEAGRADGSAAARRARHADSVSRLVDNPGG